MFQKWLIDNPALQREWRLLRCGWRPGEPDRRPWPWVGLAATAVLYALSEESTPKSFRITTGATPCAMSADGRTLFFERDDALWRLDLRRPLPELLDEATPPALPEPRL